MHDLAQHHVIHIMLDSNMGLPSPLPKGLRGALALPNDATRMPRKQCSYLFTHLGYPCQHIHARFLQSCPVSLSVFTHLVAFVF